MQVLADLLEDIMKKPLHNQIEHPAKPGIEKLFGKFGLIYEVGRVRRLSSSPSPSVPPPATRSTEAVPVFASTSNTPWSTPTDGFSDILRPEPLPTLPAPAAMSTAEAPESGHIKIFISHAAADVEFVSAFLRLLMASLFNLSAKAVRCTSVLGNKYPFGTNVPAAIREEIRHCDILIGFLSNKARERTYVMMELGAGWAFDKKVVALLGNGTVLDDTGPLKAIQHLEVANLELELMGFIDDVAQLAGSSTQPSTVRRKAEKEFLATVCSMDFMAPPAPIVQTPSMSVQNPEHAPVWLVEVGPSTRHPHEKKYTFAIRNIGRCGILVNTIEAHWRVSDGPMHTLPVSFRREQFVNVGATSTMLSVRLLSKDVAPGATIESIESSLRVALTVKAYSVPYRHTDTTTTQLEHVPL